MGMIILLKFSPGGMDPTESLKLTQNLFPMLPNEIMLHEQLQLIS